jgi:hypothetical protein
MERWWRVSASGRHGCDRRIEINHRGQYIICIQSNIQKTSFAADPRKDDGTLGTISSGSEEAPFWRSSRVYTPVAK